MAADVGMISVATSNMVPLMVPSGARKAIVGKNTIALAVTTFDSFPIVLDIPLSTVTVGNSLLANKRGKRIPVDLATDSEEGPTDDPEKELEVKRRCYQLM